MKVLASARYFIAMCFFTLSVSCSDSMKDSGSVTLDQAAESYVKLGLQFGQYDADYVDAYIGPSLWAEQAKTDLLPKVDLVNDISGLYAQLQNHFPASNDQRVRHSSLLKNMRALDTRARMSMR